MPPALEVQSLNHWTAREVPRFLKFFEILPFILLLVNLWLLYYTLPTLRELGAHVSWSLQYFQNPAQDVAHNNCSVK